MAVARFGTGGAEEALPSGRGRHIYSREFVVQNQRERMIDAIAQAVSDKGYEAATVADVIAIAGVSRRTFYEHFKDFGDCYLQAYDTLVPLFVESVEAGFNSVQGDWPRQVRAALRSLLDFLADEPHFATAGIVEVLRAGPEAIERRDMVMMGLASYFGRERWTADYGISDPELLAASVVNGIHGLLYARLVRGAELEVGMVSSLAYVALLPYLGDERAREIAYERD